EAIGHDGSEAVWPHLPEPLCRRGFHIQECIRVAIAMDKWVTPFELLPATAAADGESDLPIYDEPQFTLFDNLVNNYTGVITGRGVTPHAVAFENGQIYDPEGYTYTYSQENCLNKGFVTLCAWIVR